MFENVLSANIANDLFQNVAAASDRRKAAPLSVTDFRRPGHGGRTTFDSRKQRNLLGEAGPEQSRWTSAGGV